MQYSYTCRLNRIKAQETCELHKARRLKRRRVRHGSNVDALDTRIRRLENKEMTMSFLLDAAPIHKRYTVAATRAATCEWGTVEHTELLTACAHIHKDFLEKFGAELSPAAEKKPAKRRRKRGRHVAPQGEPSQCDGCGARKSLVTDSKEACFICNKCGLMVQYRIGPGTSSLTFEEKNRLDPETYTYDPLQHYKELLDQVQGKRQRAIPPELVATLQREILKRGTPRKRITPMMVRKLLALRHIAQTQHYEDCHALALKLNPEYKLIKIRDEHYQMMCLVFKKVLSRFKSAVEAVYPGRQNMLSYPYVAKKSCEFLGYTAYVREFSLLKSREKCQVQERILKHIFDDLNYEWVHSV